MQVGRKRAIFWGIRGWKRVGYRASGENEGDLIWYSRVDECIVQVRRKWASLWGIRGWTSAGSSACGEEVGGLKGYSRV